jgi:hypothetical protein
MDHSFADSFVPKFGDKIMSSQKRLLTITLAMFSAFLSLGSELPEHDKTIIVCPKRSSSQEILAAKEIRRYIYQRTGQLFPILLADGLKNDCKYEIAVARRDQPLLMNLKDPTLRAILANLADEEYLLRTVLAAGGKVLIVSGGDATGTLYAAYRLAEHLGVRFYLEGDVLPDEKVDWRMPDLDERSKPLFSLRGIQPFHDFPEGPDWWTLDDYKAILAQLPKLKMNFFGLHTYPEWAFGPEPTVWIGMPQDLQDNGKVTFSYPTRHFTTVSGTWAYRAKKTSEYDFALGQMFEWDDYGAPYMKGMTPWPGSPADCNALFDRVGGMLGEAFRFAKALGIKTCVGTETPLVIPKVLKEHIARQGNDPAENGVIQKLYEGMFDWVMKNYPIDFYWFWTPEDWTWGGNTRGQLEATKNDLALAISASKKVNAPFRLATCGWVLGPIQDRAVFDRILPKEMPVSCINRQVGFASVENGFARVKERPKWAIPWLEDDPGLTMPQLWVGRMRKDAADALSYGCNGLMGIHWRTRILSPNVSALAYAAWNQTGWNADFGKKFIPPDYERIEGAPEASIGSNPEGIVGNTGVSSIYQKMIHNMEDYRLCLPNGSYDLTLQFCEFAYKEKGKRVFGIELQGKMALDTLDIYDRAGRNQALDITLNDIEVSNNWLHIHFNRIVGFPSLAGIVIKGVVRDKDKATQKEFVRKVNCGGEKYLDYETDPTLLLLDIGKPRDLPVEDFYSDWALSQFGREVAEPMARMFVRLDGTLPSDDGITRKPRLPRPVDWIEGPGGIKPDSRSWEEASRDYSFVDEMGSLRDFVRGEGNIERFDHWLNNFKYLRAAGKFACTFGKFQSELKTAKERKEKDEQKKVVREKLLPMRIELIKDFEVVHRYLLGTISTTGALGTLANWQQHIRDYTIERPAIELEEILGEKLPMEAWPSRDFCGEPRIIVPTVRSSIEKGEVLRTKLIAVAMRVEEAAIHWRHFGQSKYNEALFSHVARGVYSVTLPPEATESDLEYYVEVKSELGKTYNFPTGAPKLNQTVVIMDAN